MKKLIDLFSMFTGTKRIIVPGLIITVLFFLLFAAFIYPPDNQSATLFFISPEGMDGNPGTREQPLKTFEAARDAARGRRPSYCRIIVLPGEYFISKPFELDSRDNGLTIEAEQNGTVIITGGSPVTGWYRDGEKFWCADLPGVREGTWDFRTFIVNGRMAERTRYPDTGTFLHRQVFNVRWIDIAWERKPTQEELITMAYDPKDIPDDLDVRNAEVRVYHMWDESLVGVAHNDIQRHELIFSSPCVHPPGGYGINKYVIFNTREGMTRPGQWYLDRTAGRVVYWPLKDENMNRAQAIAPGIEQIFHISGTREKKVEKIVIRGLSFRATTTSLKLAGFGAASFKGAVNIEFADQCTFEKLEISNAGSLGLSAQQITDCRIVDCNIHHTGGSGARFNGSDSFFSGNKIHDAGINYPSSVGLTANGEHLHIYRNEVYNIPYNGMSVGGSDLLVEENHIYHVMQELHDGAAIYCYIGQRIIYRGNLTHDIEEFGKGYGVSSYYFDSGTRDCIMERNVSLGVRRPIHLDYTTNATLRDNTFITQGDMTLSFQQSADCIFAHNTIIAPGKITVGHPNAISTWKDNLIYRNGQVINGVQQAFTIDSAMPPYNIPGRKGPVKVLRVSKAPTLDGKIEFSEWPGETYQLNREPSLLIASGWFPRVRFAYDDKFLYIGGNIIMRDPGLISKGSTWGKDDGLEVSIAGKTSKGIPAIFVVRVYSEGTIQSITDAGAPAESAKRLGKEIRLKVNNYIPTRAGGWSCEWAIPFNALGIKPAPGLKISFNMCAFVNEYDNWHMWEGTPGKSWEVDKAGILQFY